MQNSNNHGVYSTISGLALAVSMWGAMTSRIDAIMGFGILAIYCLIRSIDLRTRQ